MTLAERDSSTAEEWPVPRRWWNDRAFVQLVLARFREFYREPEAVFWAYIFPILMVIGLGIAFRDRPLEQIGVDIESGPQSAAAASALGSNPRFIVMTCDPALCALRLRTGKTQLVVSAAGSPPAYRYRFDPSRPENVLARNAVDDALERAAGRVDRLKTSDQAVSEPGGRYVDFLVPGLLGMSLMAGGLWGVGFVTVDMRIRKLVKRFLATPMKKRDFLAATMVSRMLFMIPEVLVLLVFARYGFGVMYYGSLWSLVFLIVLGATMFSGIGLLVASRAKTIEAVSGLMNLVMLPMWMLSGIFFTSDRFPAAVQPAIKILPLTPLIDALRSVMLEGSSLSSQAARIAIMAAWGILSFAFALKLFRWQ
ncbi:MAG TPA: ABC transporter permease [Planctomycetaceae bacterium]|jgi:ABC-type multidrug transport system permease subunit|nr:ABC transporter permease [Planctomycetaceae bacterium]